MTTALDLAAKVVTGRLPPKVLLYGLLNTLNRQFGTRHRRYEFERLYTEASDPWNYRTSAYEHAKYDHTLTLILQHRKAQAAALEIGCSIGQFSGRLASAFDQVTSVDFSEQALTAAKQFNRGFANLQFVRSPLQKLSMGRRYDVITCAEVLYYIDESEAELVLRRLDDHLAPGGIIVTVADVPSGAPAQHYAAGWEEILAGRFARLAEDIVDDPFRPYRVCIYSQKAAH